MIAQSRRKFIWFIIIGLFIFLPTDLFAQEETETPIVPTPIILPTITATVAPTSTSTSTSTATSTVTATSTSTATSSPIPVEATIEMASDTPEPEVTNDASEPTLDVSNTQQVELTEVLIPETPAEVTEVLAPVAEVEVTESVDPEPEQTEIILQPELEPELTAIVSEPFLTDTTDDWALGEGWQLVPLDGNYALQANDIAQATSYSQSTFSDVAVEALVQSQDMTIELHLRQSELDSYHLSLSPDGTVAIYKNDIVLTSTTVASSVPNQWRQIRFSVMGYTLRASVDDVEILVITDSQQLFAGDIAFATSIASTDLNQTLLVDNVRIWIPSANVPQSTPTQVVAEETATTEATASVVSTQENLLFSNVTNRPIVSWDRLALYHFEYDDTVIYEWDTNTNWSVSTQLDNHVLQLTGGFEPLVFRLEPMNNVLLEVDIQLQNQDEFFNIAVRDTSNAGYVVQINASGNIKLMKENIIIAEASIPSLNTTTWHHLGVGIIQDTISVNINEIEVILYQDISPLAGGRLVLGKNTDTNSTILLDNISISMPHDEIPWRQFETVNNVITNVPSQNIVTSQFSSTQYASNIEELRNLLIPYSDFNPSNCPSEPILIVLTDHIIVTDYYEQGFYPVSGIALPWFNCATTIHGNGHTIRYDSDQDIIGLLASYYGAHIILQDLIIQDFTISKRLLSGGSLTLDNVLIENNQIVQGGSLIVAGWGGLNMINGTTIRGNQVMATNSQAGNLFYIRSAVVNIQGTVDAPILIEDNMIGSGLIANGDIEHMNMSHVVIRRNGGFGGVGTYLGINAHIAELDNVVISDNYSLTTVFNPHSFFEVDTVRISITNSVFSNNVAVSMQGIILGRTSNENHLFEISNSCITNNSTQALVLDGKWDAQYNWWGNASGPSALGIPVDPASNVNNPLSIPPNLDIADNCSYQDTGSSSVPGILISLPPLVFTNSFGGDSEIYKSQALSYTQLTDNTFEDTNPSYSPDGQQIAFQSLRNSDLGIYVMNDDGTNEILVALNNAIEPDWYPDSSDIVFARGSDLYRINTIGTPIESQLTNHGTGEVHNPAISNDGNWIVYEQEGSLQVIDATCTASCVSTALLSGTAHAYPTWSPNGLQLAWSSNDDLYTATVNYTNATPQLTTITALTEANSPQIDTNPSWTSDGQSIIFESDRDGSRSLYQYDLVRSASVNSAQVQQLSVQSSSSGGAFPIIQHGGEPDGIAVAQAPTGLIIILEIEEVDNGTTVINGVERDIIDDRYDGQIPISGENDIVTSVTSGDLVTISVKAINSTSQVATNIQIQLDNVQPMDIIYQNINTPQGTTFDSNSGLWIISEINGTSDPTAPTEIELVIIAQVNSSLPLESYRVVTTELAQPINIQHLQQSSNLEERVVTVACEGWVNSNIFESNVRIAPRLFLDASGQESITTNDAIPNFTEVGVLEYVIAEDLFLLGEDDDNLSDEDEAKIPYAWFRITDRINGTNPANQFSRYIAAPVVSGCDELTYPFQFETYPLIATDLTATLPPPPQEISPIDINCTPFARELARNECATQVYVAFYQEFQNRNDGFPPTVRDLIAIFLSLELAPGDGLASEELLAATASNVYYGSCSSESNINPNGCDGYDVINFLQASDGWIQIGGTTINSTRLDELFNKLESNVINNSLPTTLNGYVTLDINGQTISPIAWGNYYYGTEGYNFFISNPSTSAHCEIIRSLEDGTFIDYVFVITGTTSNPATNYEAIGTPQWFDEYVNTGNEDLIPEPLATCSRETN